MVNVARPWVLDLKSVAYPNMVASGTSAETTWKPVRASIPRTRPLRELRSPHYIADEVRGGHHFDIHQGFEQNASGFFQAFLEPERTGDGKGHLRGIHVVV